MSWKILVLLLFVGVGARLPAQWAGVAPADTQHPALVAALAQGAAPPSSPAAAPPAGSAKRQAPHPAADQAPGGGPDKVWVNVNSSVYHCFGDRYYGRTAHGRYMTESAARSAGAHGPHGQPCPARHP